MCLYGNGTQAIAEKCSSLFSRHYRTRKEKKSEKLWGGGEYM